MSLHASWILFREARTVRGIGLKFADGNRELAGAGISAPSNAMANASFIRSAEQRSGKSEAAGGAGASCWSTGELVGLAQQLRWYAPLDCAVQRLRFGR